VRSDERQRRLSLARDLPSVSMANPVPKRDSIRALPSTAVADDLAALAAEFDQVDIENAIILQEQQARFWMGHALRLMVARENPLGGTVEIDEFYIGGQPKKNIDDPPPGRGRKGLRKTLKTPVLTVVQRPSAVAIGAPAGDARASVVANLSVFEAERVLEKEVEPEAHLMSDEWKAFVAVGRSFAAHDTVQHSRQEYVRGDVHANSAEGFNSRARRTVTGVFHHISPQHADLYFHEIGFRWSQRVVSGQVARRTRHGRKTTRTVWTRIPPALQLQQAFRAATGREMRRTPAGGITIKSTVAVFG
jgi:hypothetical protein